MGSHRYIVGVDEAGRGALCGPVVASCVCFSGHYWDKASLQELKDSKKLTPLQRERLFYVIKNKACYSFGLAREQLVDKINVFWAAQYAFKKAIDQFLLKTGLDSKSVLFIVDGPYFQYTGYQYKCMVKADDKVKEVSAASILAKVLRDRMMCSWDRIFRGWDFAKHKGYPTRLHKKRIEKIGLSPIHRRSFSCYAYRSPGADYEDSNSRKRV